MARPSAETRHLFLQVYRFLDESSAQLHRGRRTLSQGLLSTIDADSSFSFTDTFQPTFPSKWKVTSFRLIISKCRDKPLPPFSPFPPATFVSQQRDRGWAWMILMASFMAQLLIDGTFSCYGIFYVSMLNDSEFSVGNYTRGQMTMPGALQPCFFLLSGTCLLARGGSTKEMNLRSCACRQSEVKCDGVLVSPLINKYGFRKVAFLGSLLGAGGMAVSSHLSNLHLFSLFFGFLSGSGLGALFLCAIVVVNFYFDRFRGLASGLAMSGAGVGYLLLPLITNGLINGLGWRSALFVFSAIFLIASLPSLLTFRPIVVLLPDVGKSRKANASIESDQIGLNRVNRYSLSSFPAEEEDQASAHSRLASSGDEKTSKADYSGRGEALDEEAVKEYEAACVFGNLLGISYSLRNVAPKRLVALSHRQPRLGISLFWFVDLTLPIASTNLFLIRDRHGRVPSFRVSCHGPDLRTTRSMLESSLRMPPSQSTRSSGLAGLYYSRRMILQDFLQASGDAGTASGSQCLLFCQCAIFSQSYPASTSRLQDNSAKMLYPCTYLTWVCVRMPVPRNYRPRFVGSGRRFSIRRLREVKPSHRLCEIGILAPSDLLRLRSTCMLRPPPLPTSPSPSFLPLPLIVCYDMPNWPQVAWVTSDQIDC
ncbi:unnamed protein product [Protopolystoma xenopodis]|uniref:Major facilitator superfamily (MFS) profile domain-containing protein n=1 Tax=Protopolystoma xenopodis TaxID=117903 RepID=A0A3S5CSC2_9PLAT|nr:unnamed protein product [Protopolystoma xenopodis]